MVEARRRPQPAVAVLQFVSKTLTIERLCQRGLLESCEWGRWRLTASGLEAARRLYPEITELSARELERNRALLQRIKAWIDEHPWVTKRPRRSSARQKIEAEKGVEVDFDL